MRELRSIAIAHDWQTPEEPMQLVSEFYDDILVWGANRDVLPMVEESEFQLVFQNSDIRLFKNRDRHSESKGISGL